MDKEENLSGSRRIVLCTSVICGFLAFVVASKGELFLATLSRGTIASFLGVIIALYLCYYLFNFGKRPSLICKQNTKFHNFVLKYVPSCEARYWPLFWCAESRIQTMFRHVLPCFAKLKLRREVVQAPDGGQYYIDWYDNDKSKQFPDAMTRPTVIIIPGVTSTSSSFYICSIVSCLVKHGYRVKVLIYRGLLDMEVLTPKTYCATEIMDLEHTITTFRISHPDAKLFAVGASMGSLVLGAYLKEKKCSWLDAAMFFSCPFNGPLCARNVEIGLNLLLINVPVLNSHKKNYRRFSKTFESIIEHDKVINARHIREFDHHFTARVFGYSSAEEYYEDSVLDEAKLAAFKIPVLCVGSDDDPFSPEHALPKREISNTEKVALLMTHGGGHVSHLQGINPWGQSYFEQVMGEFFNAVINHSEDLH